MATVKFKTKRGRWVSFTARSNGPGAGHSYSKRAQAWRRKFAEAARKCTGKSRLKRNACVKRRLK